VSPDFPHRLKNLLRGPLPGDEAHQKMMSYQRRSAELARSLRPEPRLSSVLFLIYPSEAEWHTVLIERPVYEGTHSGQLAFPGGRKEDSDPDLIYTALRESEEEVGLNPNAVEIIGELTEIYIPPSNFLVLPIVGFTPEKPSLIPDPREVENILHTPLNLFFDPSLKKEKSIHIPHYKTSIMAPYYDIFGKTLWGATAMMISEFVELSAHLKEFK
jgi:8-oxo-dGTP pyrophosphatase MutT (NUDIX family)